MMRGWCVIPNPSIGGVVVEVSIHVWNAKRRFFFGTCVVTGDVVDIDAVEQKS